MFDQFKTSGIPSSFHLSFLWFYFFPAFISNGRGEQNVCDMTSVT